MANGRQRSFVVQFCHFSGPSRPGYGTALAIWVLFSVICTALSLKFLYYLLLFPLCVGRDGPGRCLFFVPSSSFTLIKFCPTGTRPGLPPSHHKREAERLQYGCRCIAFHSLYFRRRTMETPGDWHKTNSPLGPFRGFLLQLNLDVLNFGSMSHISEWVTCTIQPGTVT